MFKDLIAVGTLVTLTLGSATFTPKPSVSVAQEESLEQKVLRTSTEAKIFFENKDYNQAYRLYSDSLAFISQDHERFTYKVISAVLERFDNSFHRAIEKHILDNVQDKDVLNDILSDIETFTKLRDKLTEPFFEEDRYGNYEDHNFSNERFLMIYKEAVKSLVQEPRFVNPKDYDLVHSYLQGEVRRKILKQNTLAMVTPTLYLLGLFPKEEEGWQKNYIDRIRSRLLGIGRTYDDEMMKTSEIIKRESHLYLSHLLYDFLLIVGPTVDLVRSERTSGSIQKLETEVEILRCKMDFVQRSYENLPSAPGENSPPFLDLG